MVVLNHCETPRPHSAEPLGTLFLFLGFYISFCEYKIIIWVRGKFSFCVGFIFSSQSQGPQYSQLSFWELCHLLVSLLGTRPWVPGRGEPRTGSSHELTGLVLCSLLGRQLIVALGIIVSLGFPLVGGMCICVCLCV